MPGLVPMRRARDEDGDGNDVDSPTPPSDKRLRLDNQAVEVGTITICRLRIC